MLKAIATDIEDYRILCNRYGQEPRFKDGNPDCYGDHANTLKKRAESEPRVNKPSWEI